MAAVTEGGRLENQQLRPLAEVAKGYTYFERGDVLMAKITPCMENGKAALVDDLSTDRGFGSTEFHVLRPRAGVDARFLFYLIWNQRFREEAAKHMTGSAGQKRVPASYLKHARVPPVEPREQRRIANILYRADAIRRKRKEAIALTGELLRSAFLEMFGDPVTNPKGWPVKLVGDVAEVAGGLQVTSARSENPIPLPYLRVANVYRDRLDLNEVKEIRVTPGERGRALLRPGDVLVVEGHGNADELGRAAVWNGEIADCTHQNHLIRVRGNAHCLMPAFLSACLNSSSGRAQMLKLGKTTSGLNTISTNNVRSVRVVIPPLALQGRFEEVVRRARDLSARMHQQRYDEDLFNSLVARAFSGTLTSTEASC
jgi:type I restriction enzyme S subunit